MDLAPGTRVGAYRVIGALGRGGMGGVFEVEDDSGRRFALKAPVRDTPGAAKVTQRFAREANALRLLDHPNLVGAVDVFADAGQLFIVMEKVVGKTLTRRLHDPLEPRTALVLARQILDGVDHAHTRGIIHRDLKPDNILLVDMGGWDRVKIIDFGVVKLVGDAAAAFGANALTRTGLVFGTPAYMAPEQALGRAIDVRVDVYAAGVILYEMLAGKPPFYDPDPMVMMRLQVKAAPPDLRTVLANPSFELIALVEGALAKEPEARFSTARAMIDALDMAFLALDR